MARTKLRREREVEENLNVWPSFTDLMANAFMIISLFLLIALFKSLFLKTAAEESELNLSQSERQVTVLKRQIDDLENQLGESTDRLRQLRKTSSETIRNLQTSLQSRDRYINRRADEINSLETEIERLKSAPPVVLIQDSGEYQFNSGSAELPSELRQYIKSDLVERIEEISQQRNLYVVEIIGHTDGQVNITSNSNLDRQLEDVALGNKSVQNLQPGSNADLGLMRALEVVKELQAVQEQGRLQGVQFRAYSAAQLILPSGDFAAASRQPNASRRRIEIRFSPLGKAETVR